MSSRARSIGVVLGVPWIAMFLCAILGHASLTIAFAALFVVGALVACVEALRKDLARR